MVCVLHPLVAHDLKSSITSTFGAPASPMGNEAMRTGFVGSVGGVPVYESAAITSASGVSKGAVFHRDAIGLAIGDDIRIETQRDASARATELVGVGTFGVDMLEVNANNTTLTIATAAQTSVTSVPIVRNRNQLRDQERNVLLRKLRKNTIKTLKTDDNNGASQTSMTFRQQFVTTTTSSGEINLTAGSNESFASNSNTDYIVTILTAGSVISGSVTAAAGDNINLSSTTTIGFTGEGTNSITITNPDVFGNGAKVKVTATLTRTLAVEKTKTNQPCHLVLVEADNASGVHVYPYRRQETSSSCRQQHRSNLSSATRGSPARLTSACFGRTDACALTKPGPANRRSSIQPWARSRRGRPRSV